jgi:glycosyltransferase involved in cell wall biosynthesis
MRCLIAVDDCFLDRPGGMGRVAWDVAVALRQSGHHVAMLSCVLAGDARAGTVADVEGIQIVRYAKPSLALWHPRRAERSIQSAVEIAREKLSDQRWDVVHMHSILTATAAMRAIGNGPRYVYTMHSPAVLEQRIVWRNQGTVGLMKLLLGTRPLKMLEGQLLQDSWEIHTLSDFTRSWAENLYGLGDKVTVIPHWIRPALQRTMTKAEARQRLGWPLDKKILFTVRRLGPRYGLDVAIKAVAPLVAKYNCEFFLGGEGELRPVLEGIIAEKNVGEQIHLLGQLSDDQLLCAYQAADLFVLPTLALECFGLISIESLAFGCPVIATDVGAIPEVLRPILPNCLVPKGDVNALREKIQDFLSQKLPVPDEKTLVDFVQQNYGRDVVWPRLLQLLTGNSD